MEGGDEERKCSIMKYHSVRLVYRRLQPKPLGRCLFVTLTLLLFLVADIKMWNNVMSVLDAEGLLALKCK